MRTLKSSNLIVRIGRGTRVRSTHGWAELNGVTEICTAHAQKKTAISELLVKNRTFSGVLRYR